MLKTQIALELTPHQIAELQPLFQEATAQNTIICGSIDPTDFGLIKLAVVDRETALQIEDLANTTGEETNVRQITSGNRRDVEKAKIKS